MAMEERQTKIREGAGLEESRLNTEFIDMMKKWGPHLVTGLAVLCLAYVGYDKYTKYRVTTNDVSFQDLTTAANSASPASLEAVARDHAGTPAALEASLYAADLHMNAWRTGVPIGEKLDDKDPSKVAGDKAFLTDEQRKQELADAERLYQSVAGATNESMGQQLLAIGALNGLASVAEDRGEIDKAKGFYQQAMTKANVLKMDKLEALIKKRLESADALKTPTKLFAAADLPGGLEKPISAPLGGFTATTADGRTLTIGADGKLTPGGPAPTPGAAPVGTPAVPEGTTPVTIPGGGGLTITPSAPTSTTTTPAAPAPAPAPSKP